MVVEAKLNSAVEDINKRIGFIQKDIEGIVKSLETAKKSTAIISDMNERMRLQEQRVEHLNGISTPAWYEMQYKEATDAIYNIRLEMRNEMAKMNAKLEATIYPPITYEQMLESYRSSGVPLKSLADETGCAQSELSRLFNGEKKKEDPKLYSMIYRFCIQELYNQQK